MNFFEVLNPEEHKSWSPLIYWADPLRRSRKIHDALGTTKNMTKLVIQYVVPFVFFDVESVMIRKVENVS